MCPSDTLGQAGRTLTDIQLTGPSVTICDEDVNYLKIGLYFNGKYCLYYLDRDSHLYEYHTAGMQTVDKLVTDFINSALDLSQFEKQTHQHADRHLRFSVEIPG